MIKIVKLIVLVLFFGSTNTVNAQLFNKIKNKIHNKIENELDRTADKSLDYLTLEKGTDDLNTTNNGTAIIKHSKNYGTVNIDKLDVIKVVRSKKLTKIYGSWESHEADIHDGFVVEIPNSDAILFDTTGIPKMKSSSYKIPEEASLKLSYDPFWEDKSNENEFYSAVTKHYQSYDLVSGKVVLDVLSEDNIQITFSGDIKLTERIKKENSIDGVLYDELFYKAKITGAIDSNTIEFFESNDFYTTSNNDQDGINSKINSNKSNGAKAFNTKDLEVYRFTYKTDVKITNMDNNEIYNMSYLLNPNEDYMAINTDMSDFSDNETEGESIVVMDNSDLHIFVETMGMKMQMSQGMMGGQQMSNPTDQMATYDYSEIKKTGNEKIILGATCNEYTMEDADVKMKLWVAPNINLPNWFIQNKNVVEGYIMEYTITSKDGTVKSETIAIYDNINRIINPKEYKKMF